MKRDGPAQAHTFECAGCRRQTLTADDPARQQAAAHRLVLGRLPPHSNGISALQLQKQLGIGSYRSAWLLAHKLRASMVDPERNPLSGLVEIDEASLPDSSHRRARTQPRRQDAHRRRHRTRGCAACGSEIGAPRTSSKPPPIPTPSRKPTAGPATLRSPVATMSMSSGRPPLSSCRGSTKSSPTSKE